MPCLYCRRGLDLLGHHVVCERPARYHHHLLEVLLVEVALLVVRVPHIQGQLVIAHHCHCFADILTSHKHDLDLCQLYPEPIDLDLVVYAPDEQIVTSAALRDEKGMIIVIVDSAFHWKGSDVRCCTVDDWSLLVATIVATF